MLTCKVCPLDTFPSVTCLIQLFKDALCERLTTTGDLKSWRKMSHSDWWRLAIPENTGDSDVCKGRPMMQRLAKKNAVLYLTTDALTSFRIQVFWGRHHVKSHAGAYWRTFSMKRTLALHQHNTHRCLLFSPGELFAILSQMSPAKKLGSCHFAPPSKPLNRAGVWVWFPSSPEDERHFLNIKQPDSHQQRHLLFLGLCSHKIRFYLSLSSC